MPLFRRRQQPKGRPAHPNPAIDAQLAHIRELVHRITTKHADIAACHHEIQLLQAQNREFSRKSASDSAYQVSSKRRSQLSAENDARIAALRTEIRQLEQDIDNIYGQITQLKSQLTESDLLWL